MIAKIIDFISEREVRYLDGITPSETGRILLRFYAADNKEFTLLCTEIPLVVGPLLAIEYFTLGWDIPDYYIYDQGMDKVLLSEKSINDVLTDLRNQILYAESQYKEIMDYLENDY